MRPRNLVRTALALSAAALCAVCIAPQPKAIASGGHNHYDPCDYVRYHYQGDEEFQLAEEICDEAVRELMHRYFTTEAVCGHIIDYYTGHLLHFCDRHCARCFDSDEGCRYPRMKVSSKSRAARHKIGKCTWDACMDYDAIYEQARASLEAAGYNCLVQKLYVTYQQVKRDTVRKQRSANTCISYAAASCHCRDLRSPPADCGSNPAPPPGGGGDPPGDQDGDGGDGGNGRP